MRSNLLPNARLAKNILIVIVAFAINLKIANFNSYLHAHMRGKFSSEKEAEDKLREYLNEYEEDIKNNENTMRDEQ